MTHIDRKLEGMTQMLKVVLQRQEEMFDRQTEHFHRQSLTSEDTKKPPVLPEIRTDDSDKFVDDDEV